jgi:hypothetical protein
MMTRRLLIVLAVGAVLGAAGYGLASVFSSAAKPPCWAHKPGVPPCPTTTTTAPTTTAPTTAPTTTTPITTTAPTTTVPPPASGTTSGVGAYRATDLPLMAGYGIRRARWDRPFATTFATAVANGVELLPLADYCPWPDLNGGHGDKYPPLPQFYGEWSDRMLALWKDLPNPPKVIEVWNEPWHNNFWQPTPDPVAYLNLVKVFAQHAWAIWPNVTILVSSDTVGSTNTTGTNIWRANLLKADTTGFLRDPRVLPTTHNYVEGRSPTTVTSNPCAWDLDRYKCAYNDWKAHGHPDPQVWITEFGWSTLVVSEQTQASYTVQAIEIFKASHMVARWYAWYFKTSQPVSTTWDAYNWLRPDNTPKPVIAAVQGH